MIQRMSAFTLVELIVVITIVGVLSTIGFVSYSNYLTGARDSNRISQMVKLSDALQVYGSTKSLPLPDSMVTLTASGTVIGYQGYAGIEVLESIDYTNGGRDPKDDSYFSYYVTKDRTRFQVLALMEEAQQTSASLVTQALAEDYEKRFPATYGRKLWILTDAQNTPIQELNLTGASLDILTTNTVFTAHIDANERFTGTGRTLVSSSPVASCKRIKQTGIGKETGEYTLVPIGDIFCNFENNSFLVKRNLLYSDNTIYRGSFESWLEGFSSYGPTALRTVQQIDGSRLWDVGLLVSGTGAPISLAWITWGAGFARQVPLVPGRTYTLTFFAKSLTGPQTIRSSFQNGSWDDNCLANNTSGQISLTWQWVKFSRTCVLNLDKSTLYFFIYQNNGQFILDGVQIYEGVEL